MDPEKPRMRRSIRSEVAKVVRPPTGPDCELTTDESASSNIRRQANANLTAIMYRSLEANDYDRAARAFGILARWDVDGNLVERLGDEFWITGLEILLNKDRPKPSQYEIAEEQRKHRRRSRSRVPALRYRFYNSDAEREAAEERRKAKTKRQKIQEYDTRRPLPSPEAWISIQEYLQKLVIQYTPQTRNRIEDRADAKENLSLGTRAQPDQKKNVRPDDKLENQSDSEDPSITTLESDAELKDDFIGETGVARNWSRVKRFYRVMYQLWITHIEELYRVETQSGTALGDAEEDPIDKNARDEEGRRRELSTMSSLESSAQDNLEDLLEVARERKLKRAAELSKHLYDTTSRYPLSEYYPLIRLRGLVELWMADLSVPQQYISNTREPGRGSLARDYSEIPDALASEDLDAEKLLSKHEDIRSEGDASDADSYSDRSNGYTNQNRETHLARAKLSLKEAEDLEKRKFGTFELSGFDSE